MTEQTTEPKVPWPKTEDELLAYIQEQLKQVQYPKDYTIERILADEVSKEDKAMAATAYDRAANAMWKVAAASFYYASHVVGASGMQAGWAAMSFLREVNSYKGPFMILNGEHVCYPQYNMRQKAIAFIEETRRTYGREEAIKLLAEKGNDQYTHPDVRRHWELLAAQPEVKK